MYNDEIVSDMCSLYNSLSEKDRRRYAAIEAKKLGHGGTKHIATLFGCDVKTIRKGIRELDSAECMNKATIRSRGGGRISKLEKYDNILTTGKIFIEANSFELDSETQDVLAQLKRNAGDI